MSNICILVEDAILEFKERLKIEESSQDIGDIVHEIADSQVPVYTGQLLEIASSAIQLVCEEPEF